MIIVPWKTAGQARSGKSERAISLSRSRPSLSDFSKIWFGAQITTTRYFRIARSFRAEPALPVRFRHSIRCKSFLVPCQSSQFPEVLRESRCRFSRSSVPGPLRVPFPVLLMALVYSLLLEDFSSVDSKDTRDLPQKHRLSYLYFCGNSAYFVEMRSISRCFKA
jgi:hypothetical protein